MRRRWARATRASSLAAASLLLSAALTACFDSPPQIIALTPDRGSIGVPADIPIEVQFDRPVVPASVAGHFTVSPPIAGCDLTTAFNAPIASRCRIVWMNGNSDFVLEHSGAILAPDSPYTFTLRGGFRDPAGATNTVDHSWMITTAGAPQVRAVSPTEGAVNVPVDQPITIDFNTSMDPITTAASIHLDPDVPGSSVVPNLKDKSRFMLVPGRLLAPGVLYHLTVSTSATDAHEQRMVLPQTFAFATGGVAPGGHALVLVRRDGEPPTQVIVSGLAPLEDGLPIASEPVLTAPRCSDGSGCGSAASDTPLYTFSAAVLSPDNRWLAVVEEDRTTVTPSPTLLVLDAASQALRRAIPGATLPSWSPDGTALAYAAAGAIRLYHPATGTMATLPAGDPLVAPVVWGPQGERMALDTEGATGEHVELADGIVGARYAVPGLTGNASRPAISPDGGLLAVRREGAGLGGTWVVGLGSPSPLRLLDAALTPLGFADSTTLVALSTSTGGVAVVRVSVAGDVQIANATPPGSVSIPGVSVSPSGRQLVYLAAPSGVTNAFVENADGTDPVAITAFAGGSDEAAGITING